MTKSLALPSSLAPVAALVENSALRRALAIVAGSLALAVSAQITVPMFPVPMTMQTFAVIMVGVLCGGRLAAEIVLAYLVEGAVGLPVFAGGAAGLAAIIGNTGGYLIGFIPGAALIGWLADRGWNKGIKLAASLTAGHLIIFIPGVAWLASFIGLNAAVQYGLTPFIVGTILKTALAFFALRGIDGIARSSLLSTKG